MFNDISHSYSELIEENHKYIPGDIDWYSEYKVRIAKLNNGSEVTNILDYGCGIGLSLPYLERYFPKARIYAWDPSSESLTLALENNPNVMSVTEDLKFDLVFVAGVLHHIPVQELSSELRKLLSRIASGGRLLIFEHNPYNPVTRRLVSTCPFDQDAVLLSKRKLLKKITLLGERLSIEKQGYCLFFPPALRGMFKIEIAFRKVPLGGQFFVQFMDNQFASSASQNEN